MLAVGLFIFCNKVTVSTTLSMMSLGGWAPAVPTGLVIVPLIIGIVWMFISDGSFASKIFTTIAVLFIIAVIIMNTRLTLDTMKLYDWILILVLIFGGGAMVAKVTFANRSSDDDYTPRRKHQKFSDSSSVGGIDSQLDAMKKNMK